MKNIQIQQSQPLCAWVDSNSQLLDAGSALAAFLKTSGAKSGKRQLSDLVDHISESVNPQAKKHQATTFQYIDLAEVDEALGSIVLHRELPGRDIASNKARFRHGDILFAKIRPSLDNKKVAYVFQEFDNAIASTEFLVLRPKAGVSPYYVFAAIRADAFTSQVIASCGGDTGRQRVLPERLLDLQIPWPNDDIREVISNNYKNHFAALHSALQLREQALEVAKDALGATSFRTAKPRRKPTKQAAKVAPKATDVGAEPKAKTKPDAKPLKTTRSKSTNAPSKAAPKPAKTAKPSKADRATNKGVSKGRTKSAGMKAKNKARK